MTQIRFYHLTSTPLERALPQLIGKAHEAGMRAVVKAKDEAAMDAINTQLWTFDANSFLPHGSRKDDHPADQSIYITDAANDNPNSATVMAVTDGSNLGDAKDFERVLDLFDGNDEDAVSSARTRWKAYKDAGYELQYWQQTEQGGWQQKA